MESTTAGHLFLFDLTALDVFGGAGGCESNGRDA
jgi:hypothetical protein